LFRKYLFSLDHKVIGLQYALTSLIFLLIGFGLAIVFRWQLSYPGKAVPLVGSLFGGAQCAGRRPASGDRFRRVASQSVSAADTSDPLIPDLGSRIPDPGRGVLHSWPGSFRFAFQVVGISLEDRPEVG